MIIKYHTEQLQERIKNIFDITGISISVLDTQYTVLAFCAHENDFCALLQTLPNENDYCKECDAAILRNCSLNKKLERHVCRTGLYDSAMPIIKHGNIVGYIIMGRIRHADAERTLTYTPDADVKTIDLLKQLYEQTPILTEKQLNAVYDILPYILFEDAIQIIYDPFVETIVRYVHEHLKEELNVRLLCTKFHISTNRLYEIFRDNLNCTVNEYIIDQRIELAKELLKSSEECAYAVAERVGIHNHTYFCRLFKKKTGVSPIEYRKAAR